jgi:hypothetical protein
LINQLQLKIFYSRISFLFSSANLLILKRWNIKI